MTAALELFAERRWTVPERLSDDTAADPWRFLFGWVWASGPIVVYVGLNPSAMTATKTDATGRKWRGFAERMGCGGFIAVNAFALRSTDSKKLNGRPGWDTVGVGNDDAILAALAFPGVEKVVACWGRPPSVKLIGRLWEVRNMLTKRRQIHCWGLTKEGEPRHPLMLPYATQLEELSA